MADDFDPRVPDAETLSGSLVTRLRNLPHHQMPVPEHSEYPRLDRAEDAVTVDHDFGLDCPSGLCLWPDHGLCPGLDLAGAPVARSEPSRRCHQAQILPLVQADCRGLFASHRADDEDHRVVHVADRQSFVGSQIGWNDSVASGLGGRLHGLPMHRIAPSSAVSVAALQAGRHSLETRTSGCLLTAFCAGETVEGERGAAG